MARNVEIKARITNLEDFCRRALKLCSSPPTLIRQEDTFFVCSNGRLKLRKLGPQAGELIHYERPDQSGPALSEYTISATRQPDQLRATLTAALGELATVRKLRRLFQRGRTRIHADSVEGLGHFMELEVVLADGESLSCGEREAYELMDELGVSSEALLDTAYVDLLLNGKQKAVS